MHAAALEVPPFNPHLELERRASTMLRPASQACMRTGLPIYGTERTTRKGEGRGGLTNIQHCMHSL